MSGPALLEGWLAVCGLKREAAIWAGAARGGRAVVGGGRADLLAARLKAAIAAERPLGLISFGVAGALRPELKVGDAVVGSAVSAGGERWECDPSVAAQVAALTGGSAGVVAGSDAVAADAAAKRALAGEAVVVDMESALAARAAARHFMPLAVLRVVSDRAEDALPPAAIAGMQADGGISVAAVLLGLARDPRQAPGLIRMGRDAGRAFRRLETLRAALG